MIAVREAELAHPELLYLRFIRYSRYAMFRARV